MLQILHGCCEKNPSDLSVCHAISTPYPSMWCDPQTSFLGCHSKGSLCWDCPGCTAPAVHGTGISASTGLGGARLLFCSPWPTNQADSQGALQHSDKLCARCPVLELRTSWTKWGRKRKQSNPGARPWLETDFHCSSGSMMQPGTQAPSVLHSP